MNKLISVGQLIDQSWEQYHRYFKSLFALSAWILLLPVIELVALAFFPTYSHLYSTAIDLSSTDMFGILLYALNNFFIDSIVFLAVTSMLVQVIRSHQNKKPMTSREANRRGWKLFLPFAWVTLLFILTFLAAYIIGYLPGLVVSVVGTAVQNSFLIGVGAILTILGSVAVLVLVVRWGAYFVMAPYALLIDGIKGIKALAKSKSLIEGRLWQFAIAYVLPLLFFAIIAAIPLVLLGHLFTFIIFTVSGTNPAAYVRLLTVSRDVVPLIFIAFIYPLFIIPPVILYENLKATK